MKDNKSKSFRDTEPLRVCPKGIKLRDETEEEGKSFSFKPCSHVDEEEGEDSSLGARIPKTTPSIL